MGGPSDYAAENRRHWDAVADRWVAPDEQGWAAHEPTWGIFHVLDNQIPLLPADLNGKDVVELGCGTAYVSAWAARRAFWLTACWPSATSRPDPRTRTT